MNSHEEKKRACYKAERVLKSVSKSAVVSLQTWRLSNDAYNKPEILKNVF